MMQLRVSSKKQAKIKLALQGCSGAGKTYSALLLAYGLCGDWTKIAIIDSENGSHYHRFHFPMLGQPVGISCQLARQQLY